MGRNISVMGGAGGGQWPEQPTDNRHCFAIDWSRYKDGTVQRATEGTEGELGVSNTL